MNIYVSNLSFHTNDAELHKLFSQYGRVASAKVITDRDTGHSRGFGFVEMESEAEARNAISELNDKEIEGRNMSVSVARENKPKRLTRNW